MQNRHVFLVCFLAMHLCLGFVLHFFIYYSLQFYTAERACCGLVRVVDVSSQCNPVCFWDDSAAFRAAVFHGVFEHEEGAHERNLLWMLLDLFSEFAFSFSAVYSCCGIYHYQSTSSLFLGTGIHLQSGWLSSGGMPTSLMGLPCLLSQISQTFKSSAVSQMASNPAWL
jgi:hypothetical protein